MGNGWSLVTNCWRLSCWLLRINGRRARGIREGRKFVCLRVVQGYECGEESGFWGVDLLGIFLVVLMDIGVFSLDFVVFLFLFDALPEWEYG